MNNRPKWARLAQCLRVIEGKPVALWGISVLLVTLLCTHQSPRNNHTACHFSKRSPVRIHCHHMLLKTRYTFGLVMLVYHAMLRDLIKSPTWRDQMCFSWASRFWICSTLASRTVRIWKGRNSAAHSYRWTFRNFSHVCLRPASIHCALKHIKLHLKWCCLSYRREDIPGRVDPEWFRESDQRCRFMPCCPRGSSFIRKFVRLWVLVVVVELSSYLLLNGKCCFFFWLTFFRLTRKQMLFTYSSLCRSCCTNCVSAFLHRS